MTKKLEIPRVKSIDGKSFQDLYYDENQPIIVETYAKQWPAIDKWDASYLCRFLKDQTVLCSFSENNKHPDFNAMKQNRYIPKPMQFGDYIKHICTAPENEIPKIAINRLVFMSGEKCDYKLHLDLRDIQSDFHHPDLLGLENLELGAIWIQGQNAQSWLHFDPYENLYVQLRGQKRILLIDPQYSCEVYYNTKKHGYCEIDSFDPDFEKFPLYKDIPIYETVLSPGEMLYIPIFWFHAVESLDIINITTNWWYRPTNILMSQPSVRFLLQKLSLDCMNSVQEKEEKQVISYVWDKLQTQLLSQSYANIDDYY